MSGLLSRMPFSLAMGISLFAGRRKSRISAATVVSVAGIAVGVATLTAVMAVTGGFEEVFRERILGVYPHMVVMSRGEIFAEYETVAEKVAAIPGVTGVAASTYDEMMISSDVATSQALLKGVDLPRVSGVSAISSLLRGREPGILKWDGSGPIPVAIGCELMSRLEVQPGASISLTTPLQGYAPAGGGRNSLAPRESRFVVRDCIDSGFYDYDSRLVLMDLDAAMQFLDRGQVVRWVEVKLEDMFATERMKDVVLKALSPYTIDDVVHDIALVREGIARVVAREMPEGQEYSAESISRAVYRSRRAVMYSDVGWGPVQDYRIIDWKDMNKNLFSALRIQKVVIGLFFLIIVVVAAFNIVGTQLIVARERLKDISTLVALGASRLQMWKVFVAHGFILGCLGVLGGVGLGGVVVWAINRIDFGLDAKVYMISELPARLNWGDVAIVAFGSAAVVLLSCVFSSMRAIRINPVDGLRKIS